MKTWRTTSIAFYRTSSVPKIPRASMEPTNASRIEVYRDCVRFYAQLLINESRAVR